MENTTVKVTKKDRFAELSALVTSSEVANKQELLDFIAHEVELLAKKNSKNGKPTKTQLANEKLKEDILLALMEVSKPVTVTQLLATETLSVIEDLSNQKVSALLTQLVKAGEVVRTQVKKSAFYSIKEKETETETEESEVEE